MRSGKVLQVWVSCLVLDLEVVNQTLQVRFLHCSLLSLFFLGVSLRGVCPLDLVLLGVSGLSGLPCCEEDLKLSGCLEDEEEFKSGDEAGPLTTEEESNESSLETFFFPDLFLHPLLRRMFWSDFLS